MATQAASNEILFFIPDLGGFTKFIAETEIQHSQHIVKELLELLVDANTLGMTVGEFEGDAVLFYRKGAAPSLEELVQQARKMYLDFHTYLKNFEYKRVCQCGACAGAGGITLKMVAHFGAAGSMQVKDQVKFIGKDIIIAHRLLKNSVDVREYLLVTQSTLPAPGSADAQLASFANGTDAYDNLGTIEYRVKALDGYLGEVKVDPPPPSGLKNPRKMAQLNRIVDAPMERVYQRLIDLPARMRWIDGVTKVEISGEEKNYIGQTHRCVRGEEGIALTTTEVKVTESTMEVWETDQKKTSACRYLLTRMPDGKTNLALELYVQDNPIVRMVFKLLMQKKLEAFFTKSIDNLGSLCEKENV
jgi:hypothetical protein